MLFCFKLFFQPVSKLVNEINDSGDADINKINNSLKLINASFNLTELPNVSYAVRYLDKQNDSNAISNMIHCQQYGLYLGPDDIPLDCSSICNSSNFGYKFITQPSFLVHQEIVMRSGGYCLPNTIVKCNQFTGLMLKTLDYWTCHSKWPEVLGGDDASKIIGCNGYITDLLTNNTYINHFPTNLPLSDIYKETLPNGHYRFVCTDTLKDNPHYNKAIQYDNMGNKLIPSPTSRFVRIKNQCASLIYSAIPDIYPNFKQNVCNCPSQFNNKMKYNHGDIDDDQPCSPCRGGHILQDNVKYLNFPRNCIKATDSLNTTVSSLSSFIDMLPCGKNTFSNTTAKCINGKCFPRNKKTYSQFTEKLLLQD